VWIGRGEKDVGGQARGLEIGQLTLSTGPAGAKVRFLVERATIPSKRVIFTLVNTTHAFILGSLDCTVVNTKFKLYSCSLSGNVLIAAGLCLKL
jgi:hypothetical protein